MKEKHTKIQGIRKKIIIPSVALIALGFFILFIIMIPSFSILMNKQIVSNAEQMNYNFANEFKDKIDSAVFTSRTLASIIENRIQTGRTDREELEGEIIEIASGRPEFVTVYAIFEQGAYGDDSMYVNTDYGTPTGRFAPYITNLSSGESVPVYSVNTMIEEVVTQYHYTTVKDSKEQYISAPYIYEIDNKQYYAISIASPIMVENKFCGIAAINILVDDFFASFQEADIYKTGYITLITDKDIVAYSPIPEQISLTTQEVFSSQMVSAFQNMKADSSIFKIQEKSLLNNRNITSYIAPVAFSSADSVWKIAVNIPNTEAYSSIYMISVICILTAILIMTISVFGTRKIASNISKPMKEIVGVANEIAQGNLNVEVRYQSDDEVGELANAFRNTISTLYTYISDLEKNLTQIANKNLNIVSGIEYKGNFILIGESIHTIVKSLNNTLYEMNQMAAQVAVSADQMENSAQSIASGATEQNDSVLNLNQTLEAIRENVTVMDHRAVTATEQVRMIGEYAKVSNDKMDSVVSAMENIKSASEKIANIISSIEEIASQTNLLSLNASIEAARAGEAGKGFAVVASEISNLANESARAAQNTKDLIETSVRAVKEGTDIVAETSTELQHVVEHISEIIITIEEISKESKQQYKSMETLDDNVGHISQIVEANSAASEESAAISEELSKQSQILKDLVDEFQLSK